MLDSAASSVPLAKPGLRMKELVEASGVPKSTILYYLQQGLLPEALSAIGWQRGRPERHMTSLWRVG